MTGPASDRLGRGHAAQALILLAIVMRFVAILPGVYLAVLGLIDHNAVLVVVGLLLAAGTATYAITRWRGYRSSRQVG